MTYQVTITPAAQAKLLAQARYIAVDCHAPLNAQRWLGRVFDTADNDFRDYEVRRLLVGDYLLLFTIDATRTVWVIGFRHGRQLPVPDELPAAPP